MFFEFTCFDPIGDLTFDLFKWDELINLTWPWITLILGDFSGSKHLWPYMIFIFGFTQKKSAQFSLGYNLKHRSDTENSRQVGSG